MNYHGRLNLDNKMNDDNKILLLSCCYTPQLLDMKLIHVDATFSFSVSIPLNFCAVTHLELKTIETKKETLRCGYVKRPALMVIIKKYELKKNNQHLDSLCA